MKPKAVLCIVFGLFPFWAFGQSPEKGHIGISYSLGGVSFIAGNDFARTLTPNSSETFGLVYLYPLRPALTLETGLTYSLFGFFKQTGTPEGEAITPYGNTAIADIPVGVRVALGKYFFVNGGGVVGLTLSNTAPIGAQSGVGLYGGMGLMADFKFGGSLYLNPYIKLHSAIPFSSWQGHNRILETLGIKIGFTYALR